MTLTPTSPAVRGQTKLTAAPGPTGCKVGVPGASGRGSDEPPPSSGGEGPPAPKGSRESTRGRRPPRSGPQWGDLNTDNDMGLGTDADPSGSGEPLDGGQPGPPGGGPSGDCR